jgi:hypothetical protein
VAESAMRRLRYRTVSTRSSISAMFSQLPCFERVVKLELLCDPGTPLSAGRPRTRSRSCACSSCPSRPGSSSLAANRVDEIRHRQGPVNPSSALGDLHTTPVPQRLGEQEHIGRAQTRVLVVDAAGLTGPAAIGVRVSPTSCLFVSSMQTTAARDRVALHRV